jgi:nicotinamidase/pyrazinamidase
VSERRVGWVVDAQVDFMRPEGRLYVRDLGDDSDPGAKQVVETLVDAVAWMREHCSVIVFTGDWHALEDDEIDPVSPDPTRGTYPPHCMGRSDDPSERSGAEIISEVRPPDPLILGLEAGPEDAEEVARRAVAEGRPVFIRKTRFDVFEGNAQSEAFLRALTHELGGSPTFVVVGVARDVCVTQAVDGMQARDYEVTALSDATWGLGLEPEAVTLRRWAKKGRVTTLGELEIS